MVALRKNGGEAEDPFELAASDELEKLCRQLRLMDNDNQTYLKESRGALTHQRKILETLACDLTEVRGELGSVSQASVDQAGSMSAVGKLTSQYVRVTRDFEQGLKFVRNLKQKLSKDLNRVQDLREQMKDKEEMEGQLVLIQHKITIAKRKLETVTSKFDSVMASNALSRSDVDEALHENVGTLMKFAEMEEELEKVQGKIGDLVDSATFAYEQREEAVARMMTIVEKNLKEKKQNSLEMSELSRTIRHDSKLLDFMRIKNKERGFLETNEDRLTRLELVKERVADEALESYIDNFDKLLNDSKLEKMSDLVPEYEELYEQNLRKFEYINQLEKEIDTLSKTVTSNRSRIRSCTREILERNQTKNKIILGLMATLNGLIRSANEVNAQLETMDLSMQNVLTSTTTLFQITSSSENAQVLKLLVSETDKEISSDTLILYMNIIEERVQETLARTRPIDLDLFAYRSRSPRPSSRASFYSTGSRSTGILVSAGNKELLLDPSCVSGGPVTYAELRQKVCDTVATSSSTSSEDTQEYF